ncbi:MAG: hypothetical protein H6577_18920 [Lewinellaceae bacterium]|nr:hypothetical protein [Saprospiraceae bacterium]MCB9340199.1 hypothetical protein [Lewinellaceae bacterium]
MVIEQPAPGPLHYGEYNLLCINPQGEQLWSVVDPYNPFGMKFIYNLSEASNGDVLGCGEIIAPWPYDTSIWPPVAEVYNTAYLFRISPEGELLWERALFEHDGFEHISSFYFLDIHEVSDGSLLLTGVIKDYDSADPTDYTTDSWVVRTGADGCIYSGCDFWAYTMPTATQERPGNERQPAFAILGSPPSPSWATRPRAPSVLKCCTRASSPAGNGL